MQNALNAFSYTSQEAMFNGFFRLHLHSASYENKCANINPNVCDGRNNLELSLATFSATRKLGPASKTPIRIRTEEMAARCVWSIGLEVKENCRSRIALTQASTQVVMVIRTVLRPALLKP
jgi:hypothetical protein